MPSFIPKLRHIDEDLQAKLYNEKYTQPFSNDSLTDKLPSVQVSLAIESSFDDEDFKKNSSPGFEDDEWEIRDEANRKWWSIFNEREYKRKPKEGTELKWYQWFEHGDSKEERKLISKIDILLCFYSFVMYWVKYLDQANINNAYVSGMKEDLHMKGNDLIYVQVAYTVGSVIFQIPFMYLIHAYPTHYILPIMDVGWGLFTLAIHRANSVGEIMAYRFFVGVFESAFYPTIHYLYGSWYKPNEYGRRGGIYYFGQMLGVMTSGLLQSSAYENLHKVAGLAGWRWLFVIDTIITIPIGIIGFFVLPGTPNKCYSLFLSDEEIYLARDRLRRANIASESHGPDFFNKELWKSLISDWRFYMFVLLNTLGWNASNASSGAYILWLKSLKKYSIPLVNKYSTITPAIGVGWIWLAGCLADYGKSRFGAIAVTQVLNVLGNVILAVWHIPENAIWFAFCLSYTGWAASTANYSWAADANRHNPQRRAITVINMNMIGQATTAVSSAFVWKTVEAPRYLKGYSFTAAGAFVMILCAVAILPLYKRDERKYAYQNKILLYNSAKGEPRPVPPTQSQSVVEVLDHGENIFKKV